MIFTPPINNSSELVLKWFKIGHFSRSHGYKRLFVYFSERNGAINIYTHYRDVPLGILLDMVNDFYA
jgi:hypothetical protein